ncbi:RraA family protein [Streptomyces chartreusis]|uniref:Putative 4-hydroxy-4-methyl-2-oxoglutarate aldolase n=1 Tax=Streptomyces chartreusis TaxID=1969 RepID=A0A7I0NSK4_STRCX|nr:RraA family protein [Streptomyces chartreusis]QKZ16047.1 RraA family protein [Streptomyces chartreusis]
MSGHTRPTPVQEKDGDEAVGRLARLDACAVSDALDKLGLPGATLGPTALAAPRRITGRAVTVDLVEDRPGITVSGRHLGTAAVDASGPGDVIVVAHHGRTRVAGWGGVLSTGAKRNGVEGVIVHGACRDVDEARALDLPLYATTAVPITARGRVRERAWNVPVDIAGFPVSPGDLVIADASGVVFIPAGQADEVLATAEAIAAKERAMIERVRAGHAMADVMSADYDTMLDR